MNNKVIIWVVIAAVILIAFFYSTSTQAQTPQQIAAAKAGATGGSGSTLQDIATGLKVADTISRTIPLVGTALGLGANAATDLIAKTVSTIDPIELGESIAESTGSTLAGATATQAASTALATGATQAEATIAGAESAGAVVGTSTAMVIATAVIGFGFPLLVLAKVLSADPEAEAAKILEAQHQDWLNRGLTEEQWQQSQILSGSGWSPSDPEASVLTRDTQEAFSDTPY